jgi:hypothetical protein
MKQRFESDSLPESPPAYADGVESRLSNDHVDQLLAEHATQGQSTEAPSAGPMAGVWLGAALGIVLWTVIAGVVLLA